MLSHALPNGSSLRLFEESDVDELDALIAANYDHLAPWMPWARHSDPEQALAFIRTTRRRVAANDGYDLAIIDDAGAIVGSVGYHAIDWRNQRTSVGYWLAADAQGRGTMTEAVRALTTNAFTTWRLNRLVIHANPENARSRAIPERLGFTVEGVLRENERLKDRFGDTVVYAMLAADWAAA